MIVEHAFVTTMEASEALQLASAFLTARGFEAASQGAFAVDGLWTSAAFRRGQAKARRAKSIAELPQQVHLEWDRGRVTVAASIEHAERSSFSMGEIKADSPKLRIHTDLLLAIARGLEMVLAENQPAEHAYQQWDHVNQFIAENARRKRGRSRILIAVAIVLFALTIGMIVLATLT